MYSINVLIIEDNPGDARLIQELLAEAKESSFRCGYANSLSEAMKCLNTNKFDVILL